MSRFLTSVLVTLVSILLVQGCMTDAPPDEPIGTRADALTSTFRPTVDETLTYTDGSGSGTNRAIGGHNTTCAGSGRGAYLLFNVTSIPSNATVSSATLDITYYTDCASSSSDKCNQAQTLHVYEASASLSATSGTDTGSMGGVCGGLVGGGAAINISTSSLDSVSAAAGSHTVTFNGTSLRNAVRGWVSNSSSNHGLVVGGDANGIKMIRGGTHGSRPVLTVEWTRGNGSSCTSGTECTSGNCVDNRCCGSTSCPTCQDCTGSNGTCVNQGAGDDNTGANQCTGNNTCNSSGQCLKDRGQTCSGAGECASNFCSPDGFCCNNACSGGGVCQVCSSGTCGNVPVATDPFDQCTHACNGSGSCGTNCDEDTDCASGYYCSGGNCVVQGGGGDACTSSNQCGSGLVCSVDGVCCNSTCSGTCESCLNAENGGAGQGVCAPSPQHTDYASECAPGSCSGSSSCGTSCSQDSHCDGTAWCNGTTCITKYPNGNACSETRQCQSGICVDGVCCDGACGGQCEACDNVGSVGTCTPTSGAPHGARPACSGDGTACNGVCDGSNRTQCALPGGSVECRPASCSAGQETAQTFCVGTGSCPAATVNACAPYQCGGTGCLSSCTVDTQCQLGYRCEAGACVPARPNGEACTANTECASGYCIDGFCCNSACNGQCEACNVSGSEGSCSAVTGAPVGSRPSCADDGTACGGSCNGVARTACAYPSSTTQCRAASCETTSGTATLAAGCNGAGACPPLQTLSCPSGMCTGDACGNDCTADADCGVDEYCAAGVCQPTQNLGSPCARSAECASGRCVDGYCCNNACTGQCEACDVSGSEGVCSAVTGAPHGSRTACTDDGTGCGGSCDGTNQAACSYPGNGTVCRSAACSAGIATVEARCAGNGNCPSLQQQTCSPYTCHPSLPLCDGDCTVDGDCPSPQYCLAGICANPQGNGASCSTAAQCASGNCVDGVCCDDTCGGQCQSCSEPGSIGTCSLVAGTPRGGRPACTGTGVCAGACDGTNAGCAFPGGETVCGLGSCTNDVAVPDVSCNGAGDCRTQTPQSCAPYHCGTGSSCSTNCVTADDCQDGYECNNGACEAVPSVGGAGGTGGAAGAAGAAGTGGASTGGATTGGTAGVGGTGGTLADAGVNTEDAGNGLIPATDTGSTCRLAPASRSSNPWGIYALSLLGLLVSRRRRMPRRAVNA